MIFISLLLGLSSLIFQEKECELTVIIKGLSVKNGEIALAVYKPENEFLSQNPYKGVKIKVATETVKYNISLKAGTYAISLFHDENINGKLDKSIVGLPTEGYGFSNDAMGFLGPPSFNKASFLLKKDKTITINIK